MRAKRSQRSIQISVCERALDLPRVNSCQQSAAAELQKPQKWFCKVRNSRACRAILTVLVLVSVLLLNGCAGFVSGASSVNAAPVAPTISTQPVNQTVTAGQTAAFAGTASGTPPLSYQWQKKGANIPGAASPGYTTPPTTTSDNGATV